MSQPMWCSACGRYEQPNDEWRALWIDSDGNCRIGHRASDACIEEKWTPFSSADDDTVYACGQLTALTLVERYLERGTFDSGSAPQFANFNATEL